MAKNAMVNAAAANYILDTGSFKSAFDGSTLTIYTVGSGIPATADTAITDQVALWSLSPVNFAASAVDGVIEKEAAAWSSTNLASGTAAFCRFVVSGRVYQGTVGLANANLILTDTLALVIGETTPISSGAIGLQRANSGS